MNAYYDAKNVKPIGRRDHFRYRARNATGSGLNPISRIREEMPNPMIYIVKS